MLVLSRKVNESIDVICPDGGTIRIMVSEIIRGQVRIGLEGPPDYKFARSEIRQNLDTAIGSDGTVPPVSASVPRVPPITIRRRLAVVRELTLPAATLDPASLEPELVQ